MSDEDFVYGDYDADGDYTPVEPHEALPYPDVAAHDVVNPDEMQRAGDSPNTPEEAIAKAKSWSREGVFFGVGQCLRTVRQYYGVSAKYLTAALSYEHSDRKFHRASGVNCPRGVPVYWTGGSSGAGHIAISVGGGLCLSTDWKRQGKIDYARIDDITSHWGLTFEGFTQEINDVIVWRFPIPADTVHLNDVQPGDRNDDVLKLKKRLHDKGYKGFIVKSPKFGKGTLAAYKKYQERLGFNGADADGKPGRTSLKKLGFTVV